jgi:hypothetical protein
LKKYLLIKDEEISKINDFYVSKGKKRFYEYKKTGNKIQELPISINQNSEVIKR